MARQNSARNIERAAWSNLMLTPRTAQHVFDPIACHGQNGDVESQNEAPYHRELVLECDALLGRFDTARVAQMPLHEPDSRNVNNNCDSRTARRARPAAIVPCRPPPVFISASIL